MLALLNPRIWIAFGLAVVLGFTHFSAYRAGKANVRREFNDYKAVQQLAQIAAERTARAKEQALQLKVTEATDAARKREITLKADASRAVGERDGLRLDNDNFRRILPSLARDAVDRYASTASVVLDQCSRSYQELATEADRLASDRQTLISAWPK